MKKKDFKIIPAILEKTFPKIEKKMKKVSEYVDLVQIDIFDGRLTDSKTFASAGCLASFERIKRLQKSILKNKIKNNKNKDLEKINFDIELDLIIDMENGPKGRGDKFLNSVLFLEPKKVIFHFSGVKNWDKIFEALKSEKKYSPEIALGIWLNDENKKINNILEKYPFDYIQIMGIEKVGYGGQKLSENVFKKIKYFAKKYPNLPIQIDGGVKIENSEKLKKAGATLLVSGSGIFGAKNIAERIEEFKK